MFSTVDSGNSRFLRAYLLTAEGEMPIELPAEPDIRELARKNRMVPVEAGLLGLARRLAETRWLRRPSVPAGPQHSLRYGPVGVLEASESGVPTTHEVRLELWRYEFERTTHRLVARRFMSVVAAPPSRLDRPGVAI
jgi:hypothetical protein